jgi:hypothetical protein
MTVPFEFHHLIPVSLAGHPALIAAKNAGFTQFLLKLPNKEGITVYYGDTCDIPHLGESLHGTLNSVYRTCHRNCLNSVYRTCHRNCTVIAQ